MIQKLINKKIIILVTIVIFFVFFNFSFDKEEKEEKEEIKTYEPEIEKQEKKVKSEMVQIDIKGAIKSPGVYELELGSRVQDAINIAGGMLENAEGMAINLSKKLIDEMVIIIYTKEEIEKMKEEEIRVNKVEQTCICPKIENNACVNNPTTNIENESFNLESNTSQLVSLNQGTLEDFLTLPGIGPSKAEAILSYRKEHGTFQSVEEIKNVSGIGDSTFEKIKDRLTL